MTIAEPIGSADDPRPASTLASRRPGHAAMTHLLQQLRARQLDATSSSVPSDLLSWQVGVIGEQVVGQELALLPPGWHVLHAIPAGLHGADIDHLVIGPAGVFVLNTKHHARKSIRVGTQVVWVDGYPQQHYQQELLRRSDEVAAALRSPVGRAPAVTPVLVFVRPRNLATAGDQVVPSLRSSELVGFLTSRPPVLLPEAVRELARRAALPDTWGAPTSVLDEPDPTPAFLALPEGCTVRTALPSVRYEPPRRSTRWRRALVRAGAVAAALTVAIVVLPSTLTMLATVLGLYLHLLVGS
jgi:Nuclease-related domain